MSKEIDPRGPRFGAAITSTMLFFVISFGLFGMHPSSFALALFVFATFAWGSFLGLKNHPYALIFKKFVRPMLDEPDYLEHEAAPRFAQGVGMAILGIGLVLDLAGLTSGLVLMASIAFVAAFLNAVFSFCLGCYFYGIILKLKHMLG
jgi:hypothetical protein